jgi:hypothetical protein
VERGKCYAPTLHGSMERSAAIETALLVSLLGKIDIDFLKELK